MAARVAGYGKRHDRLRAQWAIRIRAGGVVCWRCGREIEPDAQWDLGHDDFDRSIYAGPEHPKCNRATSGRASELVASRRW